MKIVLNNLPLYQSSDIFSHWKAWEALFCSVLYRYLEIRLFWPVIWLTRPFLLLGGYDFQHSVSKNIEDDVKIDQILYEKFLQPLKNGKMR